MINNLEGMIHLPIANVTVDIMHLLLLGGISGIASGMYGIGGGIVATPIMIFYGLPSSIVIGTSSFLLLGTAITGTLKNIQNNSVDFIAGITMFLGSCVGSVIGTKILQKAILIGNSDVVISAVYVVVMTVVLIPLYTDTIKNIFLYIVKDKREAVEYKQIRYRPQQQNTKKTNIVLIHSGVCDTRYNVITLIITGSIIGLVSSLMGIGGGIIIVPAMVYLFNLPFAVASATALFQTIPMSANLLLIHSKAGIVDILLGVILIIASSLCVHLGSSIQMRIGTTATKGTLAIVVTAILLSFISKLLVSPESIFIVK